MENPGGSRCEECGLYTTAHHFVCCRGNPLSCILIIGEAPGKDEDIEGKPFVGRAGELLNEMLGAAELDESQVLIVNTIRCRPPDNTMDPKYADCCAEFLEGVFRRTRPWDIVLTLGAWPLRWFGRRVNCPEVAAYREQVTKIPVGVYTAYTVIGPLRWIPALHPAYVLRNRPEKPTLVKAFEALKEETKDL